MYYSVFVILVCLLPIIMNYVCNYYELCVLMGKKWACKMGKKWACEMGGMYHEWCAVEVLHDYDMIEKWV